MENKAEWAFKYNGIQIKFPFLINFFFSSTNCIYKRFVEFEKMWNSLSRKWEYRVQRNVIFNSIVLIMYDRRLISAIYEWI